MLSADLKQLTYIPSVDNAATLISVQNWTATELTGGTHRRGTSGTTLAKICVYRLREKCVHKDNKLFYHVVKQTFMDYKLYS